MRTGAILHADARGLWTVPRLTAPVDSSWTAPAQRWRGLAALPWSDCIRRRGLDRPAEQILRTITNGATQRISGSDGMMITLLHFVTLLRTLVEDKSSGASLMRCTLSAGAP